MSDMNTDTIYRVASHYDLELPKAVTDAEADHEAAIKLRDTIAAEEAPDLSSVTAKTLTKIHTAAVAWETRDIRLRAAEAIVTVTAGKFDNAKFTQAYTLRQPLADLFNQRAADFTTALAEMGGTTTLTATNSDAYTRLHDAGRDLTMLRQARDACSPVGSRAAVIHDRFELLSRVFTLTFDPRAEHLNFHTLPDAEFWAAGINKGHVIAWQDTPAQEQNSAAYVNARQNPSVAVGAR